MRPGCLNDGRPCPLFAAERSHAAIHYPGLATPGAIPRSYIYSHLAAAIIQHTFPSSHSSPDTRMRWLLKRTRGPVIHLARTFHSHSIIVGKCLAMSSPASLPPPPRAEMDVCSDEWMEWRYIQGEVLRKVIGGGEKGSRWEQDGCST